MPFTDAIKRLAVGRALRSDRTEGTLLPKRIALPVYASDALSSNAYATQEILIVLAMGGLSLVAFGPWIAAAVVLVFFVVIASYRLNVRAYPSGGGDYEVVAANLGPRWGVVSASALLVDYVLTVAVSISAAVANLGSSIDAVGEHAAWWAIGFIVLLTLLNLRGIRQSGIVMAIPTYAFIGAMAIMVVTAVIRLASGAELRAESAGWTVTGEAAIGVAAIAFVVARAFSSGTTALTGIEAVANGVPSFREPKARNAARTLLLLGVISMSLFASITALALITGVQVAESDADISGMPSGQSQKTVIVQIAGAVFNDMGLLIVIIALATALILFLAANTAFNGFPILGSILARDGYLPRQLHTRGDRLAYSNGILALGILAIALVIVYQADVTSLIQLYIVGVFLSFSMSQFSMVRHWNRAIRSERSAQERGRLKRYRLVSLTGFALTTVVLVIVLASKFLRGAWIVVVAIPVIYLLMRAIRRHYDRVRDELQVGDEDRMTLPSRVHGIVLVSRIHKPALRALAYARATRPSVLEAITVSVDPADTRALQEDWGRRGIPVTLRVLESPFRGITRPVLDYVRRLRGESPRDLVTVFIPEYVVGHWWEHLLHNQSALRLRTRLRFTPGVMVVSVPWQLASSDSSLDAYDG